MFLKKIDIYGSKIGLSVNGLMSLNSYFGGIFTINTIIIYILLFNLFAKDFYLRINPRIDSERVYLTDSVLNNYTISNDTFLFAMENPTIYKDLNLYKISLNYVEEKDRSYIITELKFITCDKTQHSELIDNYDKAKNYYCIDFTQILNQNITNIYFTDNVKNNYIHFTIYYNNDYLKTLNETYKQELLNFEKYIYFYSPILSFSPNNYQKPLDIRLKLNRIINQKIKIFQSLTIC